MNLLKDIKSYFPDALIDELGQKLGEKGGGIVSLVNTSIPTIMSSLISKAATDNRGVFEMAKNAFGTGKLGYISSLLGTENTAHEGFNIWDTVKGLFGDKLGGVLSALSAFAGTKESSAQSVLGMTSMAALGVLGKQVKDNDLDAGGFASLLGDEKHNLTSWIPEGFDMGSVAGLLGLGGLFKTSGNGGEKIAETVLKGSVHHEGVSEVAEELEEQNPKKNWLIPLLILVALGIISWALLKGCNHRSANLNAEDNTAEATTTAKDTTTATTQGSVDSAGNWVANVGANKTITLPDGSTLTVGENSTEYKLFNFITNNDFKIDTVDKTKNWVSFDRVFFETGKANLTAASMNQIKNIGLILKNYPNASIKIGGYTDNTGSAQVNTKVSQERADIVASELKKAGAGTKQIVEAVGYGPEHPVASNDTPEGKAQNRRVDLKLASK